MELTYAASRTLRRHWACVRVVDSGCWEWTGGHHPTGYGSIGRAFGGYAHRWTYEAVKGPIPAGLTIDHLCRNRGCVNPDHLEAVTYQENVRRSPLTVASINAAKTHCIQGHPFDVANTRITKDGRDCRACHRIWNRAWRAKVAS